jgi:hypothetical protein
VTAVCFGPEKLDVQADIRLLRLQTRTSANVCDTIASPPVADMTGSPRDVAEGPKATSKFFLAFCLRSLRLVHNCLPCNLTYLGTAEAHASQNFS